MNKEMKVYAVMEFDFVSKSWSVARLFSDHEDAVKFMRIVILGGVPRKDLAIDEMKVW